MVASISDSADMAVTSKAFLLVDAEFLLGLFLQATSTNQEAMICFVEESGQGSGSKAYVV